MSESKDFVEFQNKSEDIVYRWDRKNKLEAQFFYNFDSERGKKVTMDITNSDILDRIHYIYESCQYEYGLNHNIEMEENFRKIEFKTELTDKRPNEKAVEAKSHKMLGYLQPLARVLSVNLLAQIGCKEGFYEMYSAFRGNFEDKFSSKEYLVEIRPNNKFRVYIGKNTKLFTEINL